MYEKFLILLVFICLIAQTFMFNNSLDKIDKKLENVDNGLNYLYTYNTNLSTTFEDRNGLFPVGSYNAKTGNLILVTKNLDLKRTCLLVLHELGHKQCFPDLTEKCANEFEANNLWRCETI